MARRRPPPSAATRALALVLLVAVGIGGTAALLPSATRVAAPTGPTALPGVSAVAFLWGSAGLLLVLIGYFVVARLRSGRAYTPLGIVVPFLVAFLVAIAFLIAVRYLVPSPPPGPEPIAGNTTTGSGTGTTPATNTTNNTTLGRGSIVPGAPPWIDYVLLGGAVAIAVLLFAIPRWRESREDAPPPPDEVRARAAARLREALSALDGGTDADPRAVVIALYARLLGEIEARTPGLEARTPREIERVTVDRLGVPRAAARTLTAVFEEARYSSHPLPPASVERARSALRAALAGLGAEGGGT